MNATRHLRSSAVAVVLAQLCACGGGGSQETPPQITSADSATFAERAAGVFTVTATGTPAPHLAITGALPTGVTFDPSTGALSGTPATGTTGTYPLVITARNGADPEAQQEFTLTVTPSTFSLVSLDDIQAATLSTDQIDGNDDETNQLPTGTILLYQTGAGRYGKLLIASYGYTLVLDWVTYDSSNDGTVYSQGNDLSINGTWGADLDAGVQMTGPDGDFFWAQWTSIVRTFVPTNGAKFAIRS